MVWHRPQRLLPSQLVAALDAAHAGEAQAALRLLGNEDGADALTADTVRLVRGLAASEGGDDEKAQRFLRPLMRAADLDVALASTLACVEMQMRRRGFARAAPWLQRAWRHAQDETTALVLEASLLLLRLRRGLPVDEADLGGLRARLQQHHALAVHATIDLLTTEHALHEGSLGTAARAERAARPAVAGARLASLRRWHQDLRHLLHGDQVALVEDWKRPRRAMTRTEIADLEAEPWQLWADSRHQKLYASGKAGGRVHAGQVLLDDASWNTLRALLEAPGQRLPWHRLQEVLSLPEKAAAQERVSQLQRRLGTHSPLLRPGTMACALGVQRFVHLLPLPDLPAALRRLLPILAERPGASGLDLAKRTGSPLRTIQRHLQLLRQRGLVLIVGGGRDARYWAI